MKIGNQLNLCGSFAALSAVTFKEFSQETSAIKFSKNINFFQTLEPYSPFGFAENMPCMYNEIFLNTADLSEKVCSDSYNTNG